MAQPHSSPPTAHADLVAALAVRYARHPHRHPDLQWADVLERLLAQPEKLAALAAMEASGGEPDVVGRAADSGAFVFVDCAAESPTGRRSLCYDREALAARKAFQPEDTVLDRAAAMGIELLTEAQYRELQRLGAFDTKTSSWLQTPPEIRKLGGAIFGDRRYGQVFIYHNGASSYYAVRGFRGSLKV